MIDVPINNKELIEKLDKFLWFYEERENLQKYTHVTGEGSSRNEWVSEKYLEEIQLQGHEHEGFPDKILGWNVDPAKLIPNRKGSVADSGDLEECNQNTWLSKASTTYSSANFDLGSWLCIRNNALATLYPPNGFISWHNNANAAAYNFIFTWSETGEGHFKYLDAKTGEIVVLQDKKGWNCKAGYFGSYNEYEEFLCYHAAETDCWRFTLGYMMDGSDSALGNQEDLISEISDIS
jgi:hypothetical protein|tara:strand:+ start:1834 stop:2541 length:708 start_codon:yes stop_codon:yes gene_type:complete